MSLTVDQRAFLEKAIDLSWSIADAVHSKGWLFFEEGRQVSSTLVLAEIISNSRWGAHPLVVDRYPSNKRGKYSNNVLLLEADKAWSSKTISYEGKEYKTFEDWGHLASHFSDCLTLRPELFRKYAYNPTDVCYDNPIIEEHRLGVYEFWRNRTIPEIQ